MPAKVRFIEFEETSEDTRRKQDAINDILWQQSMPTIKLLKTTDGQYSITVSAGNHAMYRKILSIVQEYLLKPEQ